MGVATTVVLDSTNTTTNIMTTTVRMFVFSCYFFFAMAIQSHGNLIAAGVLNNPMPGKITRRASVGDRMNPCDPEI